MTGTQSIQFVPTADPTQLQQIMDIQRRQQLASQLLDNAKMPASNDMAGNVVYKHSPLEYLARGASQAIGSQESLKAQQMALALQGQQFNGMFGGGDQSSGGQGQGGGGLNSIPGFNPIAARVAYMAGPGEFSKYITGLATPPDAVKTAVFGANGNTAKAQEAVYGGLTGRYGTPITYTDPQGNSHMVSPDQFSDMSHGAGAPAPAPVQSSPLGPPPGGQMSPSSIGAPPPPMPGNLPMPQDGALPQPDAPAVNPAYNAAVAPSQGAPAPASGVSVQSPAQAELGKTDATNTANYKQDLLGRVSEGAQAMNIINAQESLLSKFKSGAWESDKAGAAAAAKALGAPDGLIQGIANGDPGAVQGFESLSAQHAMLQAKALLQNGRLGQQEFKAFQMNLANPDKQEDAIRFVNQVQRNVYNDSTNELDGLVNWKGDPTKYRENYELQRSQKIASSKAYTNAPMLGAVSKGYRYKGGDPSQQDSWEQQ